MVPSTFRLPALAVVLATAVLFAFPAARQGLASSGANGQAAAAPAQAAAPAGEPLATLHVKARLHTIRAARPAKPRGFTILRVRAGHSVAMRAKPAGAPV